MIFKLVLKHVFKAETEEEILKASVIYGWSLALVGISCALIMGTLVNVIPETIGTFLTWGFVITLVLFIVRYTSVKPILGAAAGGITVIAIGTILDNLTNRKDSAFGMGALFGVILVLFFMILKNLIVAWYYLVSETYRYYRYKKNRIQLEETVLANS